MMAQRFLEPSSLITWRPDAAMVRRGVEVTLVLLLAAQAARLAWMVITPASPLGEPVAAYAGGPIAPPADLSILERFAPATPLPTPTIMAMEPTPVAATPTIAGFKLQGVRASIAGDGGSAIIAGPDGQQASYRRGDTVGPGVTLAAIGRDAVTLSGVGGSIRLILGADSSSAAPVAPPFSSAPGVNPGPSPTASPRSAAALGFNVGSAAAPAPPGVTPPAPATLSPSVGGRR